MVNIKKVVSKNFINWNLVFNEQLTHVQRDLLAKKIIHDINIVSNSGPINSNDSFAVYFNNNFYDSLRVQAHGRKFKLVNAGAFYCQCQDSLLWNLRADLQIDESGGSVPQHPKPTSTGPQGGIDFLSYNDSSGMPATQGTIFDGTRKLGFPEGLSISTSGFISVIDTGIDSTLLDAGVRESILPFGENGSQNVMLDAQPNQYLDASYVRHGTSVASIILNEYYRQDPNRKLPRLMVLKAMDDSGRGDVFGMACAILQSINSKAKLINISAGYYGEADSVLNHFMHLSKEANIPIIAAAGNYRGAAANDVCRTDINKGALLGDTLLFYPACVSPDTMRYSVISVTGLQQQNVPCYYQNFSSEYVTIGVINQIVDTNCCEFTLPFFKNNIALEGTSFATPVVSGRLAHALMNGTSPVSYSDFITLLLSRNAAAVGAVPATRFVITH